MGEYISSVWSHSVYTNKVNVARNDACKIITKLHILAGIASPNVRKMVIDNVEFTWLLWVWTHPLFDQYRGISILNPGICLRAADLPSLSNAEKVEYARMGSFQRGGSDEGWIVWISLNRLWRGVAKSKDNLLKWGILEKETFSITACARQSAKVYWIVCRDTSNSVHMPPPPKSMRHLYRLLSFASRSTYYWGYVSWL